VHSALEGWQNFYVIVGSSAGALTGLQFVVVALVADTQNARGFTGTASTFATPTVVHFSFVLVLSAVLAAPWPGMNGPMVVSGLGGAVAVVYTAIVGRRASRQEHYKPVLEDWLFHVYIPAIAYLTIAVGAALSDMHVERALFAVGAGALLLLIVGVHNAWDTVTYIVATRAQREVEPQPQPQQPVQPKPGHGRRR
jgi:hypothetical protein